MHQSRSGVGGAQSPRGATRIPLSSRDERPAGRRSRSRRSTPGPTCRPPTCLPATISACPHPCYATLRRTCLASKPSRSTAGTRPCSPARKRLPTSCTASPQPNRPGSRRRNRAAGGCIATNAPPLSTAPRQSTVDPDSEPDVGELPRARAETLAAPRNVPEATPRWSGAL